MKTFLQIFYLWMISMQATCLKGIKEQTQLLEPFKQSQLTEKKKFNEKMKLFLSKYFFWSI